MLLRRLENSGREAAGGRKSGGDGSALGPIPLSCSLPNQGISPWTCASENAGLWRPIAEQEAGGGVRRLKSPFTSGASLFVPVPWILWI